MEVLFVVIPILVVLAVVMLVAGSRRRDRGDAIGTLSRETRKADRGSVSIAGDDAGEAPSVTGREVERAAALERRESSKDLVLAAGAPPAPYVPPDPETIGVTRRQFFNRSLVGFMLLGISGFGAAVIAFLWPKQGGGFGAPIVIGQSSEVLEQIAGGNGFLYRADGKMWLTAYPPGAVEKAQAVYPPTLVDAYSRGGVTALYQKCPHLGCRVPSCETSQWFECPCHGSQYNQVGEKKGGPAPRGMDRFAMEVDAGGKITVLTGTIIQGPPIGTNTTGQEAEGPHCIGGAGH